jgi:hypothetical protein
MELLDHFRSFKPTALVALGLVTFLTACTLPPPPVTPAGKVAVRNNAASLLYNLMGDEKNVSKLLVIKRDRRELHEVIKKISTTADAARRRLERLVMVDSTLDLTATALPAGEKATRESESKARGSELLHASGADFEFKLLLTQAESLAYATHLAKVAEENEASPDRARVFAELGAQMKARHGDVLKLLREPVR